MKCEKCGIELGSRVILHRTGKKGPGEDPHWQCAACIAIPVDPEVKALTELVAQDGLPKPH